jgi:hypothetical protein
MEIDGLQICLVPLTGNTRIELDCVAVSEVKIGNGSGDGEVTISQDCKISTIIGKIKSIKGFISDFSRQTGNLYQGCFKKIYTNS